MNALWLLWTGTSPAATLTVDPSDAAAYPTISAAVAEASSGDTVSIVAGTYTECIETLGTDLTLTGPSTGAAPTVDATGLCDSAIAVYSGETVTVQHLAVTNGSGRAFYLAGSTLNLEAVEVTGSGTSAIYGGGVDVSSGTLNTTDCTFTDNTAIEGGAIYLYQSATWTDVGSVFTGNTSSAAGGAVFAYAYHNLVLSGSQFTENVAGSNGGALAASWYSALDLSNTTFTDNIATGSGGAIYTYVVTGDFVIADSRFTGNEAQTGWGGALQVQWYSLLQVLDSLFEDNHAAATGGAISQWYETSGYGSGNTFVRNRAGSSGGGWYWNPYQGRADDLAIYDSAFAENESGSWGGGVFGTWADELHIEGSTFDRNIASGNGGGLAVYVLTGLTMHRNRFCANTATLGGGAQVEWADLDHITNTTFIDNAAERGGGLFRYVSNAGVSQYNAFVGNAAQWGGAFLDEWGTTTLDNTAFFHNVGGAIFTDSASTAAHTSVTYDAWGDNDPIDGTGYFWVVYGVDGNVTGDPRFAHYVPGDACAAQDLRPLAGSVLVDAGDPADTDPDGSRADIGAFAGPDAPVEDHDGDGSDSTIDCLDGDPMVHPGADELCDGVDNNCDGIVDGPSALDAATWYVDLDGDGYGNATESTVGCGGDGMVTTAGDCDDADPASHPGAEDTWYDGIDANCDGANDHDADGDGHEKPVGENGGRDCDDTDASVHPGAEDPPEDGVDQDCDGADDAAPIPDTPEEEAPRSEPAPDSAGDKSGCSTAARTTGAFAWCGSLLALIRRRRPDSDRKIPAPTV